MKKILLLVLLPVNLFGAPALPSGAPSPFVVSGTNVTLANPSWIVTGKVAANSVVGSFGLLTTVYGWNASDVEMAGNQTRTTTIGGGFIVPSTNDFYLENITCYAGGNGSSTGAVLKVFQVSNLPISGTNGFFNFWSTSALYSNLVTLTSYSAANTYTIPKTHITNGGYVIVLFASSTTNTGAVKYPVWNSNPGNSSRYPWIYIANNGSIDSLGPLTTWASAGCTLSGYITNTSSSLSDKIVSVDSSISNLNTTVVYPSPVINWTATNYACDGHEFNIYWDNLIRDVQPLSSKWISFSAPSSWGTNTFGLSIPGYRPPSFIVIPTIADIGSKACTLTVGWNTNILLSYNTAILVSGQTNGTGVTRKILFNGDSTTGSSGYATLDQLWRFQNTNSGLKLTFIGTQGTGTTNHEAISGSSWAWWYSGGAAIGGKTTPFTNGAGTFDFNFYLTNNSFTMASGDWFVWKFGINDVFALTSDTSVSNTVYSMTNTMYRAFTNIQTVVPGIRIGLCITIPPTYFQDGFGISYGSGQSRNRYVRNRYMLAETLCSINWSGVYLWPIHAGLDTVNNFSTAANSVNAWNTNSWTHPDNGVHPANSGYYQIADELWAILLGFK